MEKLRSTLGFGGILSEEEINHVLSHFKFKKLTASDHFHSMDVIANEVAFVEKGIFRVYAIDAGDNEVTKYFVRENQFMVDLESYYAAKPSNDAFQAAVNAEIYIIRKSIIETISKQIPNFYIFIKSITEAQLLNKIKDNDFLNFGDSKTKYVEFVKRYPALAQQVPQQYIASYLKITAQSLSRIRKQLAGKRA